MPDAEGKFAPLFELLDNPNQLALAVSGGPDSTALMVLAAQWARQQGGQHGRLDDICVLTVDHALRENSDREAEQVGQWAKALGLKCHILTWQHDGQSSGIQKNARAARYRLMGDWCRANGFDGIITAHNADDQAETMLMRLARGSGVDGLGGMAEQTEIFDTIIHRPLLDVSRATLQNVLKQASHSWLEDPSNKDQKFERVRVRIAMPAIHEGGIKTSALNLSAKRLRRARTALDHFTDDFMASSVTVFNTGHCEVDRQALEAQPDEIALRVLSRLLTWAGGAKIAIRLAKVERLYEAMSDTSTDKHTLGGAQIAMRKSTIIIGREFGRIDPKLQKAVKIWDNRFTFSKSQNVQPYGLFIDGDDRQRPEDLPYFVACSLPVICDGLGKPNVASLDLFGKQVFMLSTVPTGVKKLVVEIGRLRSSPSKTFVAN